MSDITTTIDLLRHGEPVGGRKFRGLVDDPLSDAGWRQMWDVVGDACPWDAIVASPLSRCADFARELAGRHNLSLQLEPDLREVSFGAWDGRVVTDVDAEQPEALSRFWRDPVHHPPPDGEPLLDFDARVGGIWKALLARHCGRHILVVAHGGTIRIVLRQILDMPLARLWRLAVPYAGLSRVRVHGHETDAQPQLLFHAGILP